MLFKAIEANLMKPREQAVQIHRLGVDPWEDTVGGVGCSALEKTLGRMHTYRKPL